MQVRLSLGCIIDYFFQSYVGYRERIEVNGEVDYERTTAYWENIFARAIFFIIFEVLFDELGFNL